jgi:hypothetical protein
MTARYGVLPGSLVTTSLLDLIDRAEPDPVPLALTKRAEFFLEEMMAAGNEGITTIDYPGVRVGDAIHKLRKAGVNIETAYEQHGGEFAGAHGRYKLKSKVVRLFDTQPTSQPDAAGEANHA